MQHRKHAASFTPANQRANQPSAPSGITAALAILVLAGLQSFTSTSAASPRGERPPSPPSAPAGGPWQVTITDLGVLPGGIYSSAYAINGTGKIVGMASAAGGALKTVQWVNGEISIIPGLSPSAASVPADLNDAGEIVGTLKVGGQDDGIYWDPQNTPFQLDGLPGVVGSFVRGSAINASGQIAGRAQEGPPNLWGHAAVWDKYNFQTDLGFMGGGNYSDAHGINDAGHVVGVAAVASTNTYAFLWKDGQFTNLSTWGGGSAASIAYAINNQDEIVGVRAGVATRWKNGTVQALPMPPGISPFTAAVDINDAGDIIATGSKGFPIEVGVLWRNGEPIDLGTLPGGTISRARRINAAGEIVGEANAADGFFHAVKWTVTPVGPPCPNDLDGSGVVDGADLAVLLAAWGGAVASADLNQDGTVDAADLGVLLGSWGSCGG